MAPPVYAMNWNQKGVAGTPFDQPILAKYHWTGNEVSTDVTYGTIEHGSHPKNKYFIFLTTQEIF